jgi:hypothetical protein
MSKSISTDSSFWEGAGKNQARGWNRSTASADYLFG